MPIRLYACCAALLLLAACAAAVPGYTPPPFKEKSKHSKAMESGEMVEGHYEMAEQEKQMDCKRTTGAMMVTINRMKYRNTEVAPSDLAIAANKVASPYVRHSTRGVNRDAEYTRDRARLEAYNGHLAAKGCKTVNIDAELARPPEPTGQKY